MTTLLQREQHRPPGPVTDPDPPAGSGLPTRAERVASRIAEVARLIEGDRARPPPNECCARCGGPGRLSGGYCRTCRATYMRGWNRRHREKASAA
jgi:hypothetical protein